MKKLFNKEFIIGISVICAIVVLIFGIEYLKGINMLSPSNYYYVSYSNVSGLEVSAPVSIDGFKVGQVREISYDFDHPGKIKVLLAVDKKLKVPEDSYAEMASTLMGGAYIDIKMGKSKRMLAIGADIPAAESTDLMTAVTRDIMPSVNSILPKVDSLLYNLNMLVSDPALLTSVRRLDGITGNVYGITQDVHGMTAGLNSVVGREVPVILGNTRQLTTRLDSMSYNLGVLSYNLRQLPFNTTIDNLNATTANLEEFSRQLNDKNSTLGLLTSDPELYYRLNRVTADVDSLIVDIKKNPKRYISIKLL